MKETIDSAVEVTQSGLKDVNKLLKLDHGIRLSKEANPNA